MQAAAAGEQTRAAFVVELGRDSARAGGAHLVGHEYECVCTSNVKKFHRSSVAEPGGDRVESNGARGPTTSTSPGAEDLRLPVYSPCGGLGISGLRSLRAQRSPLLLFGDSGPRAVKCTRQDEILFGGMRSAPLLLLALSACGSSPSSASGAGTSTGAAAGSTSTLSTSTGSSSGSTVGAAESGSSSGASTGDSSDDIPPGFLNPLDGGGVSRACSFWIEDCPPGEKCMPYSTSGGISLNGTRCSPIAPDPGAPGDPCTVEDSVFSGIDTCELHSICWSVGPRTNEGTCIAMCIGTESSPTCPAADQACRVNSEGTLALCRPLCDPLTQNCDVGEGCYPVDDAFVCAADGSVDDRGLFEPCESINGCTAGFACVASDRASACDPDIAGCCVPYCSVANPDCPTGRECAPWYEEAGEGPIGFGDIGVCVDGDGL